MDFLSHRVNQRVTELVDDKGRFPAGKLKDGFNHRQFGAGGVEAGKCGPVVDTQATADTVAAAVDGPGLD